MGAIGEKITEFRAKVTSATMTEAGLVVNGEGEAGPFGTIVATMTLGPAVDAAGETGPMVLRGTGFSADGSTVPYVGSGVWRTSGHHKWEVKGINQTASGERVFFVQENDLATRSMTGTIYNLD